MLDWSQQTWSWAPRPWGSITLLGGNCTAPAFREEGSVFTGASCSSKWSNRPVTSTTRPWPARKAGNRWPPAPRRRAQPVRGGRARGERRSVLGSLPVMNASSLPPSPPPRRILIKPLIVTVWGRQLITKESSKWNWCARTWTTVQKEIGRLPIYHFEIYNICEEADGTAAPIH